MRATRFLLLLPALSALLGTTRTAAADSTLSVSAFCFNNGGGIAACNPYVTGGTGIYVSYHWQFTDRYFGQPTYNSSWTESDPWMDPQICRVGGTVTITLTVTDSQGETGTDTQSIRCSQWAD